MLHLCPCRGIQRSRHSVVVRADAVGATATAVEKATTTAAVTGEATKAKAVEKATTTAAVTGEATTATAVEKATTTAAVTGEATKVAAAMAVAVIAIGAEAAKARRPTCR